MAPINGDDPATANAWPARVAALLFAIRASEHTYEHALSGACYGLFYAGIPGYNQPHLLNQAFTDYSDHPALTGACLPVPLPPNTCRNAGLNPGCVSTAAGAYQIIRPTWREYREADASRGWGRLPDFSPTSQDAAAVRMLDKLGALAALAAGSVEEAIALASRKWASLPGSEAKQNPKQVEYVLARFNEGLSLAQA